MIWSHKCCCCLPLQLLGNDTTQQFDNLKVNLSNVNVFNNETRNSLTKLGDSGVDNIDFAKFLDEVKLQFELVVCCYFIHSFIAYRKNLQISHTSDNHTLNLATQIFEKKFFERNQKKSKVES